MYFEFIIDGNRFSSHDISAGVQDFLICIEMAFAAWAHLYAFGYGEFRPAGGGFAINFKRDFKTLGAAVAVDDVVTDVVQSFRPNTLKGSAAAPGQPPTSPSAGSSGGASPGVKLSSSGGGGKGAASHDGYQSLTDDDGAAVDGEDVARKL